MSNTVQTLKTYIYSTKYFSISLEDFIGRELKVNDLSKINTIHEQIGGKVSHNLNPSEGTIEIASIPFLKIQEVLNIL